MTFNDLPQIGEVVNYYRRKAGGKIHGNELVPARIIKHQEGKRPAHMTKIYIELLSGEKLRKTLVNLDSIQRL